MGTHFYRVEICKKRGEEKPGLSSLVFNRTNNNATDNKDSFLLNTTSTKYLDNHNCREAVSLNMAGYCHSIFWNPGQRKFLYGVRAYGEQHTAVVEILEKYKDSHLLLEELIEKTLGLKSSIRFGRILYSQKDEKLRGSYLMNYLEGNKVTDGYITVYLSSWENVKPNLIDIKISALLAMLREPLLIKWIMKGYVKNFLDLSRALLKISYLRLLKRSSGYDAFFLSPDWSHKTIQQIRRDARTSLSDNTNNFDGSDWLSILRLSVFFFLCGKDYFSPQSHNGKGGPNDFLRGAGNSEIYENYRLSVSREEYIKCIAKEMSHRESIGQRYDKFILQAFL